MASCSASAETLDKSKQGYSVILLWSLWSQNSKHLASWWFQPIWKILVKLDHFPKYLKPPTTLNLSTSLIQFTLEILCTTSWVHHGHLKQGIAPKANALGKTNQVSPRVTPIKVPRARWHHRFDPKTSTVGLCHILPWIAQYPAKKNEKNRNDMQ